MLIGSDKEHIVTIEEVAIECADEINSGISEKIFIENFKMLCKKLDINLSVFKASNNRYCISRSFKNIIKFVMLQSIKKDSIAYEILKANSSKIYQYQDIIIEVGLSCEHVNPLYAFYSEMYEEVKHIEDNVGIVVLYMIDKKFKISIKQYDFNIRYILNLINTILCRTLKATLKVMTHLYNLILGVIEKFVGDNDKVEGFDLIGEIVNILAGKETNLPSINYDGVLLPDTYQKWSIDFLLDNILLLLNKYDEYMVCIEIMDSIESMVYDFYLDETENQNIDINILDIELKKPLLTKNQMETAHEARKDFISVYKLLTYKMNENHKTKNTSLSLDEMLDYQKVAPDFIKGLECSSKNKNIIKIYSNLKDIREIEKDIFEML